MAAASCSEAGEKEITGVLLLPSAADAVVWQVPKPEVGLEGLQEPLVQQFLSWHFRSVGLAQKGSCVPTSSPHRHRSLLIRP